MQSAAVDISVRQRNLTPKLSLHGQADGHPFVLIGFDFATNVYIDPEQLDEIVRQWHQIKADELDRQRKVIESLTAESQ